MFVPTSLKPRVFGYARASTSKQVTSPDIQKDEIRAYCLTQGLGDITFFVDAAVSGSISWHERPAGKELFKQLKKGDHVVVGKLDRAFRKLANCVEILEKFERMGIKLHICNLMGGAVDLSSPMGKFMIHMLAAFAELERAFISERIKEGMAKCVRSGTKHSKHAGYGFTWEKRIVNGVNISVRVRNDAERNVMRSILMWRMQDAPLSWSEITEHLDNMGIKTKDGIRWTQERIRRVCECELRLQLREQKGRK